MTELADEARVAREAAYEVLASRLGRTLDLVERRDRGDHAQAILDHCAQAQWLAQTCVQLGGLR